MKKNNKKAHSRKEIIDDLYLYTELDIVINGSLQEVAENILALEKRLRAEHQMVVQNPDKYIRFGIRISSSGCDDSPEINLYGVRMETDTEFEKRIAQSERAAIAQRASAKKRIENKKKKELATFLRLRKKYDKK
jgi:hypothetical protein